MNRFVVIATIVGFLVNLIQLVLWLKGGITLPREPESFWDRDFVTVLLVFGSVAFVLGVLGILWRYSEIKSSRLRMDEVSEAQIAGYIVIGTVIWQFTFTLLTLVIRKIWGIEGGGHGAVFMLILVDLLLINQMMLVAPVAISRFFAPHGLKQVTSAASPTRKSSRK